MFRLRGLVFRLLGSQVQVSRSKLRIEGFGLGLPQTRVKLLYIPVHKGTAVFSGPLLEFHATLGEAGVWGLVLARSKV